MWIFKQRVVEVPTVAATLEICIFLKTVLFASINSLINIWGHLNGPRKLTAHKRVRRVCFKISLQKFGRISICDSYCALKVAPHLQWHYKGFNKSRLQAVYRRLYDPSPPSVSQTLVFHLRVLFRDQPLITYPAGNRLGKKGYWNPWNANFCFNFCYWTK